MSHDAALFRLALERHGEGLALGPARHGFAPLGEAQLLVDLAPLLAPRTRWQGLAARLHAARIAKAPLVIAPSRNAKVYLQTRLGFAPERLWHLMPGPGVVGLADEPAKPPNPGGVGDVLLAIGAPHDERAWQRIVATFRECSLPGAPRLILRGRPNRNDGPASRVVSSPASSTTARRAWLQAARAVVLCGKEAASPLALLEAAALGIPCVAPRLPPWTEAPSLAGAILHDPDDPAALSRAITEAWERGRGEPATGLPTWQAFAAGVRSALREAREGVLAAR